MEYELKGKQVLVTGATGLIGSNVTRRLLQQGSRVRAFVRNPARAAGLEKLGAEIVAGDITDREALQRAVQGCPVVFHFAAALNDWAPLDYYRRVNVDGTRLLAEAALAAGVERFIHCSSVAAYGLDVVGTLNEDSPRRITGHSYAGTKAEGEQVIQDLFTSQGLPAITIQPCVVYGPEDRNWTLKPIQMIRSGRMVYVDGGKGLVQPIYIDDVAEGALAAACLGRPGQAYILGYPETITFREFFGYYVRMTGKPEPISLPRWLANAVAASSEQIARWTHGEPIFSRSEAAFVGVRVDFDVSKAREELGFSAKVLLEEGMRRVEAWVKEKAI